MQPFKLRVQSNSGEKFSLLLQATKLTQVAEHSSSEKNFDWFSQNVGNW